jgi:cytochrome P450
MIDGHCRGPIIRISPYEIHVNDPDFLDVLYVSGSVRRTEKYPWAVKIVGNGNSSFVTIDHDLHRLRRGAYAPFFSKASVQKQAEPVVQPIVNKLVRRLQQLRGTGVIINLNEMYASLTGDIISQYALGAPYDLLDHPDFSPHWYQAWSNVAHNVHLLNHFGWVVPLMSMMPVWMVNFINPRVGSLFRLLQVAS